MCELDRILNLQCRINIISLPSELAIAHLSAVELPYGQLLDIRLLDNRRGALSQKVSPNRLPGVLAQIWVSEWEVDSTLHRLVEVVHAIGRKE